MRHEMLIANAGSGKTFRLTVRTIILLAHGVEPAKIVALTFTRKAAGEFLAAVFLRLADAATRPEALQALRENTHLPDLDAPRCRQMLIRLSDQLHRLTMGTIDSLFARIARSFPLETRLSGDFTVLGDTTRKALSQETLATVFRGSNASDEQFQDFLDLVRQQSRKQSEQNVFNTLLTAVNGLHEKFLATPRGAVWGDAAAIWPTGCRILAAGSVGEAAAALWQAITSTHPALDPEAVEAWKSLLQLATDYPPEKLWTTELTRLIKRKTSIDRASGRKYFPTGHAAAARVYLHEDVERAWEIFLHSLFKPRLEELLRRSRALHGVLASFEEVYAGAVREQGQLTFSDITSLLAAQVHSDDWRAKVGYRLDGQFDHWLLDEFQDTSRLQWQVLHGLVDDLIQDTAGGRSFFYVGDTKQAIYLFRGGDPRLFFEIAGDYNQVEERISRADPLDVSYRSDPQIIAVVNTVFGNIEQHGPILELPARTLADWKLAWVPHEVAEMNAANVGYVRWQPVEKSSEEDDDPACQGVASILHETQPWERGWSCAVLMRTNQDVEGLAALLQGIGIPVAVEGRANPCTDNPLGVVLLAAFRFAAAPEDRLSRSLLVSCPQASGWLGESDHAFRKQALGWIAEKGFAAAAGAWVAQLDLTNEPFLSSRAQEFVSAATQFDALRQSGDDIGAFVHHIENYQRLEPEGAGVVRLMTVHQAKGMTLDMTIVAGLDNASLTDDKTAGALALEKNSQGKIWGLLMPGSEIVKADPILRDAREEMLAAAAYGELCAAYVAMTRPRHALYVLTRKLKEGTTAKNFARLLTLTLGFREGAYESGAATWYASRPLQEKEAGVAKEKTAALLKPFRRTPRALSPSNLKKSTGEAPASRFFSAEAAQLGREVHAALAQIEWLEIFRPDLGPLSANARQLVETILQNPAARTIFSKPETPCLLWRERAFECFLDGQWVAGVFDRVLVFLKPDGTPDRAEVVDFKTDRDGAPNLQTRHAAQMAVYQRAAALLLGLDVARVSTQIVGSG